jgi:glycosyltransferase involved in cell wall biosynthesis
VLVARALSSALSEPEIAKHLEGVELSAEVLAAFRGAIRIKEMKGAVAALRGHLEAGEADESVYQEWCENHTWAFGNAYVVRDDVRNISTGDRLDLLLPTVIAGYRDLVELKRPDMNVLNWDKAHRNYYFSAELSSAIGQCHRYLDVLHDVAAKGLLDNPEIVAYHPRAIIVIGRSHGWDPAKHRALHGLNRRLSGITVLLKSAKNIITKIPTAKFIIAGDGPEKKRLMRITNDLKITSNVEFTGKVTEQEKIALYQKAWVFVNPSLMEGWGITSIEANACGTPVIGSNVPGLSDSIKNPHSGLLVPYGNTDEFTKAILKLVKNDRIRKQMEKDSLEWANKYDWANSAKSFLALI